MPEAKDYALIVGIDDYSDAGISKLKGAKNDAEEFLKWFRAAGGYDSRDDNAVVLLSDPAGTQPEFSTVTKAIGRLLSRSDGSTRIGRRLYIFLAGHGIGPRIDEAGLLTIEATQDLISYIPGRQCADIFRLRALFEEVVLCMDCCRDFDAAFPDCMLPFRLSVDAGGASSVKKFYVYATGFGRQSREKPVDGTTRGVFSKLLIDGLKGAAVNGDGAVTGESLKQYIKDGFARLQSQGFRQSPEFIVDDDFVFAAGLTPKTVEIVVELADPNAELCVLQGSDFSPVAIAPAAIDATHRKISLPDRKAYLLQAKIPGGAIIAQTPIIVEGKPIDVRL